MNELQMAALVLAVVGAVNWGLVGLFGFDLVAFVTGGNRFGTLTAASRIVYIAVAVAGIVALTTLVPGTA